MPKPRIAFLIVPVLTLGLAACASNPERAALEARELAIYERHAGEPVDRIRSFRLQGWQPVSDYTLLLETRLNQWYLVEVAGVCNGLRFAQQIGVRSWMNTVTARLDNIIVDGVPCQIRTIRPIDLRAARSELQAARSDD